MSRILVNILLLSVCTLAYSQVPPQGNQGKLNPSSQRTNVDKRGTKDEPFFVQIQPTKEDKEKANRDEQRDNATQTTNTKLAFYTSLLAVVGFLQVVIIGFQLLLMRNQHKANKLIERSYVKLSHAEPGVNPANRKVEIEVKNTGRAPATVMGARLGSLILNTEQSLPRQPPYEQTVEIYGAQAFLHAGDLFYVRHGLEVSETDWNGIEARQKTLYVIGLVEYVDIFNVWHRAGYARRYAHGRAKNNLAFVAEGTYSFDIIISARERLTGK